MTKQVILSLVLLAVIVAFRVPTELPFSNLTSNALSTTRPDDEKIEPPEIELSLEAKSVYIFDIVENKILYEKNSSAALPLASLTKLMAAIMLEESAAGEVYIPVSKNAASQPESEGIRAGDRFLKSDLLDIMLAASSNDAAYAAAEFLGGVDRFVGLMNARARELGFSSLSFSNPHGLDIVTSSGRIPGAAGNAQDIARLFRYIYEKHPGMLEKTRISDFEIVSDMGRVIYAKNTNEALGDIPGLIGSKTGYTALAGGNLVFMFKTDNGHIIITSILGSSEEGRFDDAREIVRALEI